MSLHPRALLLAALPVLLGLVLVIALLVLIATCATRPPAPFESMQDCEHYCHRAYKRCQAREVQVSFELGCGDRYVGCLQDCGF